MANVNIRVDDELKRQAVRYGGIPFDLRLSDPFYCSVLANSGYFA